MPLIDEFVTQIMDSNWQNRYHQVCPCILVKYGIWIIKQTILVCVFQIKYVDEVQLGLLRLLSNKATQTFTYLCKNTAAFYSLEDQTYEHAIELRGENDHEFKTEKLNRKSVTDNCQVGKVEHIL